MSEQSPYNAYSVHKLHKESYDDAFQDRERAELALWNARDDARTASGKLIVGNEVRSATKAHTQAIAHENSILKTAHDHYVENMGDLQEIAELEAHLDGVQINIEQAVDVGQSIPVGHDLSI